MMPSRELLSLYYPRRASRPLLVQLSTLLTQLVNEKEVVALAEVEVLVDMGEVEVLVNMGEVEVLIKLISLSPMRK